MQPKDALESAAETASALRPWVALVQAGMLVGVYAADEAEAADRAATRLALAGGRHVEVYEVAASLPPPPPLGTLLEPARLGWVNAG